MDSITGILWPNRPPQFTISIGKTPGSIKILIVRCVFLRAKERESVFALLSQAIAITTQQKTKLKHINKQQMKNKTTFLLWKRLIIFLVLLVPLTYGYGQERVYATKMMSSSNVSNSNNAVDGDLSTKAVLSKGGIAGTGSSSLEIGFTQSVPANKIVFIKIGVSEKQFLTGLLGSTLGGILDGVVSGLIGNQVFDIVAKNGSNVVYRGASDKIFEKESKLSVIQDDKGDFLLSVNIDSSITSIHITNSNKALLPFKGGEFDVYGAFYENSTAADCGKPVGTSYDAIGIDISLLKGFTDNKYHLAIDSNAATYSVLKSGGVLSVGVGGHLSQYFNFPTTSAADATFNIKIGANKGLLDLNVINALEVRAYNKNQLVYNRSLSGGLLNGTELLTLLNGKEPSILTFAPGKAFDKVELRINTAIGVELANDGLHIYDVERYDGKTCVNPQVVVPTPTAVPFETASCATSIIDFENVDFATNAIDGNNETYASLIASAGSLLSSLPAHGMIQMGYDTTVPAYTTSYIRIDSQDEVLEKLLGGTLGKALDAVVGALIGDSYFEVEAYNGSTSVAKTTSQNGFAGTTGGKMTVVQDKMGRYYLAVTPNSSYNSIKVTNKVSSIPNGETRTLKVYNMCREIGTDACFAPQFTSYDQKGVTLSLGKLGEAGAKDPYKAISDNSSEYSEISTGLITLGGSVGQMVYFNTPSQIGDELQVRLQLDPTSLASINLIGSYKVKTYLGDKEQETFGLQQGLVNNLDLLSLFKSGGIQTLKFDTRKTFDRVEINAFAGVNVSVTPAIRLYGVKRVNDACSVTTGVSPFISPVCATTLIGAENANDINNLFDGNFDSYTTLQSGAGILLGLGKKEGYVELGYENSVKANVTSYVRIDFESDKLKALLGGSLGNVVGGLLNNVLLGDHYFKVEVKDSKGRTVLEEGSQAVTSSFKNGKIRVIVDALGRTYLAITPSKEYKSIKITDVSKALVGATAAPNSMNVYGMCYETGSDTCAPAFATSYEYDGLSLSVNDLGKAGVTNPEWAINENTTNFSQISLGTLGVGASVKQFIYFNTLSVPNDVTKIRLKVGQGGVTVPLLESLEIIAYNGDAKVATLDWKNGLVEGVDVLNLIKAGNVLDIPFKVAGRYDRISVGIKNVLNVGVFPPVELYGVTRSCSVYASSDVVSWKSYKVDGNSKTTTVKGGEMVEYTIHVKNNGSASLLGFTVNDELPKGLTYVSGGDFYNGKVHFTSDVELKTGKMTSFSFIAKVNDNLEGIDVIKNIAVVRVNQTGEEIPSFPPTDNNKPTTPDTTKKPGTEIGVTPNYDVAITKTGSSNGANSNQALVGDELTYLITVKNTGNKDLKSFVIQDVISEAVPAVIEIIDNGGGIVDDNKITYKIGVLKVGESIDFTLKTKVKNAPSANEVVNKAVVTYKNTQGVEESKEVEYKLSTNCKPIDKSSITTSTILKVCYGEVVELKAKLYGRGKPKLDNPIFKWYKTKDRTDVPQIGSSITVTALADTTYYVTVEDFGYCFQGDAAEVKVELDSMPAKPTVNGKSEVICSGDERILTVNEEANFYQWYLNGVAIEGNVDKNATKEEQEQEAKRGKEKTFIADQPGVYTVRIKTDQKCFSEPSDPIVIEYNPVPELEIEGGNRRGLKFVPESKTPVSIKLPVVYTNGSNVVWNDHTGKKLKTGDIVEFTAPGIYTLTVSSESSNGCATFESLVVNVWDSSVCPPLTERVYATGVGKWQTTSYTTLGGFVAGKENATDTDPTTHSTISTTVALLGLGTTWQNIYFDGDQPVPAGTPVTIKLGKEYSGLVLAGGMSVVGLDANGKRIGAIKPVAGGVLDLLASDNVFEYTFVPSDKNGAQAYHGVQISLGALVGVAQLAKVYGVYYEKRVDAFSPGYCAPVTTGVHESVLDVLHGVQDIGLGVASATASVSHAWNAVDDDLETYAMISRGVAVANMASLTVVFKQQAVPGDKLHIITEVPGNPVLSLELIKGYKIQRYLGDQKVGEEIDGTGGVKVIDLKLLGIGYKNKFKMIIDEVDEPFDRVKISYGSIVGVLGNFTKVYEVSIAPKIDLGSNFDIEKDTKDICNSGVLEILPSDACSTYKIFTQEKGGDELTDLGENKFKMPGKITPIEEVDDDGKPTGVLYEVIFVQTYRNGCLVGRRIPIKVKTKNCSVKSNLNVTHKIKI
ncbi:COG1361 family protein [Myroides phaeus]|uniref:Conserved repeat domain-containing protein n=1 Tax=Myroides phaeus TaxID=702745 RepID=A0A1G8DL55_9FLAO|nr:DUF11 domain-containing protein [Myroides phaeus]SDH58443.1 conserved repeat domain-containing protein [Myroides phaeus]